MNQKCKVCGEPAAGFHFGAFTCEGCKSFFGRTYSNVTAIGDCKNGGHCVINKKNRTSCKACRLRKCLLVGMSKSGSRYGRRSNWFKIHCLLQEQTGLDAPLGTGVGGVGGVAGVSPNSLLYNGLHRFSPDAHDTSRTTPEEENNSSPSDLVRSPSSVTSSEHSDEAEEPSKENLRLLLTATPHYDPPESGMNHSYRKRKILRTASPEAAGPSSPKAGLLASSGHPILYHQVTSPKLPPESSCSGRNSGYQFIPHSLYHLITRAPSSVYGEDVPEQEGPIDLSCKTSMSPASTMCHIRAEILTAGIGVHRENDGAPLDLTTKA